MLARSILLLSVLGFAAPALAQSGSSVVVLGVRSVEGDDDVAHDLTNALREAAQGVSEWQVSSTAVSMAQMALAHGCEDVDAACLADIANGLHSDLVIYGTLRRNSAREDFDFAFSLSLFDAKSGSIVRGLDDTIPRNETTKGALSPRAKRLITRLAGGSAATNATLGSIAVESNIPGADVLINGQPVGSLENGSLQFDGLQPGAYRLEVRAHGYAPFQTTVQVKEGQQVPVSAQLEPGSSDRDPMADWETGVEEKPNVGHGMHWLGWTLIGVGGAALIGTAVSWVQIVNIDQDDRLADYSDQVARSNRLAAMQGQPLVEDFCERAAAGIAYESSPAELQEVQDLCSEADLWEVLQYVFLGTAVVAGAGGIIVLMTAGDRGVEHAGAEHAPSFALQPSVSGDHAAVSATLRF